MCLLMSDQSYFFTNNLLNESNITNGSDQVIRPVMGQIILPTGSLVPSPNGHFTQLECWYNYQSYN